MTKVLIAASEAVPFAKTGGLADVCGTLPHELRQLGHEVTLILPAYRQVHARGYHLEDCGVTLEVPVGNQSVQGRILRLVHEGNGDGVSVYFIEQRKYFDRPELYGERGTDYRDNCERFVFFSRAVLEAIRLVELDIEIIHCNDWQTALIPVLLDAEYRCAQGYEVLASLLTIHNLAYQGRFWHWDMLLTGLDWRYFDWRRLEFYGDLNLLKGGIVYADAVNTVSPTYAKEIQRAPLGCGLEGVLFQRRQDVSGILNGVDYGAWNPADDPHLAQNYDVKSWQQGKAANKARLQQQLGLPVEPQLPLLGIVGRLADQKGIHLVAEIMGHWLPAEPVQWVVLGSGHPKLEEQLRGLAAEFPQRVAVRTEFSEPLAHQIEAGADLFLMPSRYEPCGLNQLYSLKYGTLPLVHATGGLRDTVDNCTEESLVSGTPTGFCFYEFSAAALDGTLRWALQLYRERPAAWRQLVENGMVQDWSWKQSAAEYAALYQKTIARVKQTVCA